MADKFSGFADNLINGALNPKGNLADWQHASRLFVTDAMRLSPKSKFLYHVNFNAYPSRYCPMDHDNRTVYSIPISIDFSMDSEISTEFIKSDNQKS